MGASERIVKALEHVPNDIALKVTMDIDKRLSDWFSSGGKEDHPYIDQQVRFAENIGKRYGDGNGETT